MKSDAEKIRDAVARLSDDFAIMFVAGFIKQGGVIEIEIEEKK